MAHHIFDAVVSLVFLYLLHVNFQQVTCSDDAKTIRMTHIVYRHGARSPVAFYPNALHQEKDWPNGRGWLTLKGIMMEYQLGKFLRSRYVFNKKLTGTRYNHKEAYVQSTGKDRCIQSAQSQMAGLFPPERDQIWNPKIRWQPIPVHVPNPVNNDPILRGTRNYCPKRDAIWAERKTHPIYRKKVADSAKLFKRLSKYSGMKIDEDTLWILLDVSRSEREQGFQVPKWIIENYLEIEEYLRWTTSYLEQGGDELARLVGGPLLSKIISDMSFVNHTNKVTHIPKMNIFSGHDHSIVAFAAALGVKIDPPDFGACIMVELYHNKVFGNTVELYYRNKGKFTPLKLTGCDYTCPVERFVNLTANRASHNREKECRL